MALKIDKNNYYSPLKKTIFFDTTLNSPIQNNLYRNILNIEHIYCQ